jgi:pre-mRNA-splicing factor 38B
MVAMRGSIGVMRSSGRQGRQVARASPKSACRLEPAARDSGRTNLQRQTKEQRNRQPHQPRPASRQPAQRSSAEGHAQASVPLIGRPRAATAWRYTGAPQHSIAPRPGRSPGRALRASSRGAAACSFAAMQQYGNPASFNIENVLTQNIINSDYFRRQCVDLKTWEELVDEIFDNVTDVEPWMSGNARGPSSAFCLLYRMGQIKPTVEQVNETIRCKDSPYIRAVSSTLAREQCAPGSRAWEQCGRPASTAAAPLRRCSPPAPPPPCPLCRWASCTCATSATQSTSGAGASPTSTTRRCAALPTPSPWRTLPAVH